MAQLPPLPSEPGNNAAWPPMVPPAPGLPRIAHPTPAAPHASAVSQLPSTPIASPQLEQPQHDPTAQRYPAPTEALAQPASFPQPVSFPEPVDSPAAAPFSPPGAWAAPVTPAAAPAPVPPPAPAPVVPPAPAAAAPVAPPAPAQAPAAAQSFAPPQHPRFPDSYPAPAGAPAQQFYPAPVPEFPSAGFTQPGVQPAEPVNYAQPAPPTQQAPDQLFQPQPEEEEDADFDSTVVISRGKFRTKWTLIDADGRNFPLTRTNVLGRKPTSGPDDAQFIALSDPERVLSRTHVLIEIDGSRVWITDLKSTNGTEIDRGPGAGVLVCAPLSRYEITAGQSLSLGGRAVRFRGPE